MRGRLRIIRHRRSPLPPRIREAPSPAEGGGFLGGDALRWIDHSFGNTAPAFALLSGVAPGATPFFIRIHATIGSS